jgi:hypothetical protein
MNTPFHHYHRADGFQNPHLRQCGPLVLIVKQHFIKGSSQTKNTMATNISVIGIDSSMQKVWDK